MLPRIAPKDTLKKIYLDYLSALRATAFKGEIHTDYAARLSVATDNSIYQVIPQAVIFPKDTNDISAVLKLGHDKQFREVTFSPRGGGTATNGQSLSAGIIIDCSRYMREILELNVVEKWVRVQPGVVLDQLNVYLKPHGVYFAPEISPSNRATLGGMINTDACGNGSKTIGRTSDHIADLTYILCDGDILHSSEIDLDTQRNQTIQDLLQQHRDLILEKFTHTPRTLGGYNLKKALTDSNLNLNYLLCGSEGTLAVIGECKLKLSIIPTYKKLVVVKYRNFDDALRAHEFINVDPLVIEAIDEKLIELARHDAIYLQIKDFIENGYEKTGAINLVEFIGDNEEDINRSVDLLCKTIKDDFHQPNRAIGFYVAQNAAEIKLLWDLRKQSVGLISKKTTGSRRPIPFVEDTAVPPEKLADYISEFKTILDEYGLVYGMYGHVDAGCVHVRPALDMKLTVDEKLIREISDKVVALIKKFGGVLWGEHGQGYRSDYGVTFFGETLHQVIRQIKTLFDPYNQLNPGKIAVPLQSNDSLVKLEGPMRGQFDKTIDPASQKDFATAVACNGNGACFNYATQDTMCPSFKVTQDRVHSPKGRAGVVREWLRQLSIKNFDLSASYPANFLLKLFNSVTTKKDFSHEVYAAMSGCLGCKACATQCPINVDVPEFKSKFLSYYHGRYRRPLRDYLIASVEQIAPMQARFHRTVNWLFKRKLIRYLLAQTIKLVDLPLVSVSKPLVAKSTATVNVILLQDVFTTYLEPYILLQVYDFLTQLGYSVRVVPFFENGKPLHAKGFMQKFSSVAKKNIKHLRALAKLNIPIIGIDPSVTLTYRDEYQKVVPNETLGFSVKLLQEWLYEEITKNASTLRIPHGTKNRDYYLLSHCTEKTACAESESQWKKIFAAFGLNLIPLSAGCCGMAGSYGHEAEHLENSKKLFAMDWQRYLLENPDKILATGYSCRSQTARLMGIKLLHPAEVLKMNL